MLIPDRTDCPAGACRSTTASPSTPLQHPTLRGSALRGINEGSSNSPVRSSPRLRPPGWNGPPLGLSPELRTPPTRSRTTHVEVGTGHRARTWNYTLNSHQSISNPVVHSSCATSRRTSASSSGAASAPRRDKRRGHFGAFFVRVLVQAGESSQGSVAPSATIRQCEPTFDSLRSRKSIQAEHAGLHTERSAKLKSGDPGSVQHGAGRIWG